MEQRVFRSARRVEKHEVRNRTFRGGRAHPCVFGCGLCSDARSPCTVGRILRKTEDESLRHRKYNSRHEPARALRSVARSAILSRARVSRRCAPRLGAQISEGSMACRARILHVGCFLVHAHGAGGCCCSAVPLVALHTVSRFTLVGARRTRSTKQRSPSTGSEGSLSLEEVAPKVGTDADRHAFKDQRHAAHIRPIAQIEFRQHIKVL